MRSRDDNARGAAECVIDSRDRKPRSIIPVVYERERCFNWFVARFEPVKQEKARGNDGLRTAVHARILQRAVMDAAADALAESLGAVASELLLATENAADDPNFSISPENCARYGIYCTVVRGMAFIVLSAPLIRPRIVLQYIDNVTHGLVYKSHLQVNAYPHTFIVHVCHWHTVSDLYVKLCTGVTYYIIHTVISGNIGLVWWKVCV